ncbi:uncharacterized protein LOC114945517 [Nylanderia fulva]|uniref:uncharacterized protein LOC114945517 n=1 Tax=Nylanderia fulva TaxID=613905 RepID=UPI0010FB79BA|nr:uncharacterized protein LOC114945517 [Nylanderia fulva]
MGHSLMAICVLVALIVLARFIHGRPAVDESGLNLSMSESRASKLEDVSRFHELKAISASIFHGSSSFPAKSRQKRTSDQRIAELQTLMSLYAKYTGKRSLNATHENWQNIPLDPEKIGRRKRFVNEIPAESVATSRLIEKPKRDGDPTYPLVS